MNKTREDMLAQLNALPLTAHLGLTWRGTYERVRASCGIGSPYRLDVREAWHAEYVEWFLLGLLRAPHENERWQVLMHGRAPSNGEAGSKGRDRTEAAVVAMTAWAAYFGVSLDKVLDADP